MSDAQVKMLEHRIAMLERREVERSKHDALLAELMRENTERMRDALAAMDAVFNPRDESRPARKLGWFGL